MKRKAILYVLGFLEWIESDQSLFVCSRAPPWTMLFEWFCIDVL